VDVITETRVPSFWVLQLCGWGAYAMVVFASNAHYISQLNNLSARETFVYRMTTMVCFIAASFPLHAVCRRQWRAGHALPRAIAVVIIWSAILAFVSATIGIEAQIASGIDRQLTFLAVFGNAISGGFILFSWSGLYFGIKYYQALEAERHRALALERTAREAQLRALQYQIQPHFLFNSLNAISTLIAEERNDEAETVVTRLADFFRATLELKAANEVALEDELFLTRQYLEIEKARLGDRLGVDVRVDPEVRSCLVPHLLLQPLVENAIRHGIAPRDAGGSVSIEAKRRDDKLFIVVSDNGLGMQIRSESSPGDAQRIGLVNTETRIKELYGESGQLSLNWPADGGCQATLEIPCRQKGSSASNS